MFRQSDPEKFVEKIKRLRPQSCYPFPNGSFYAILPSQSKEMRLKKHYKPSAINPGLQTLYNEEIKKDALLLRDARVKLQQYDLHAEDPYQHNSASLKLHISINNIGEIREDILLGLIALLIRESEDPTNRLNFHFKILNPAKSTTWPRYTDNDQLTLYFDKYSSTADLVRLTKKIEEYLKSHGVKENIKERGEKDQLGFNSFVSGRFDTNKLDDVYAIFNFFDLELKKFFATYKANLDKLEDIPLYAFEVVFNNIILSKDIKDLRVQDEARLSDEDSKKVQAQFAELVKDPTKFLRSAMTSIDKPSQEALTRFTYLKKLIAEIESDFTHFASDEAITAYMKEQTAFLQKIIRDEDAKKLLDSVNPNYYVQLCKMAEEKQHELQYKANIQRQMFLALKSLPKQGSPGTALPSYKSIDMECKEMDINKCALIMLIHARRLKEAGVKKIGLAYYCDSTFPSPSINTFGKRIFFPPFSMRAKVFKEIDRLVEPGGPFNDLQGILRLFPISSAHDKRGLRPPISEKSETEKAARLTEELQDIQTFVSTGGTLIDWPTQPTSAAEDKPFADEAKRKQVESAFAAFAKSPAAPQPVQVVAPPASAPAPSLLKAPSLFSPKLLRELNPLAFLDDEIDETDEMFLAIRPKKPLEEKEEKSADKSMVAADIRQKKNTSDHTYQSVAVELISEKSDVICTLRGSTWNLMNKCESIETNGTYKNNPWNIDESPTDFLERKQRQLLEKIIEILTNGDRSNPANFKDFMFLQETDIFTRKLQAPFEQQRLNLIKQFDDELKKLGFAAIMTQAKQNVHPMVTIVNTNTLELIPGSEKGALMSPSKNKNRAFACDFIHKKSKQKVRLVNLHLDYDQDYSTDIPAFQKQNIAEGMFAIMGGDTNHAPNTEIAGLINNWNNITNIHGTDDGKYLTGHHEDDVNKCYDGFFANPSAKDTRLVITEEKGEVFKKLTDGSFCVRTLEPALEYEKHYRHTAPLGRAWQRGAWLIGLVNDRIEELNNSIVQGFKSLFTDSRKAGIAALEHIIVLYKENRKDELQDFVRAMHAREDYTDKMTGKLFKVEWTEKSKTTRIINEIWEILHSQQPKPKQHAPQLHHAAAPPKPPS